MYKRKIKEAKAPMTLSHFNDVFKCAIAIQLMLSTNLLGKLKLHSTFQG